MKPISQIREENKREFEEKWLKGHYIFYFEYEDKNGKYRYEVQVINDPIPYDEALKMAARHVAEYGNSKLKDFRETSFLKNEIQSFLSSAESRILEGVREWAKSKTVDLSEWAVKPPFYEGRNAALSDLISFLEERIKK